MLIINSTFQKAAKKRKFQVIVVECAPFYHVCIMIIYILIWLPVFSFWYVSSPAQMDDVTIVFFAKKKCNKVISGVVH